MPATKPKIINGLSFEISQPYEAGHVLTEIEARVLNQTRSENVGNNARAKIKEMVEGGTEAFPSPASEAEIIAYVAEVDATYEFRTASDGASRSRDPYETEASKIARELLKAHLAQTGRKINVAPDGETADSWKEKVNAQVEKLASTDSVLAAAKKNVDAKRKQGEKLLEALADTEL